MCSPAEIDFTLSQVNDRCPLRLSRNYGDPLPHQKPLRLLDVDGVLNPTGNTTPPHYRRYETDEYVVSIHKNYQYWLFQLNFWIRQRIRDAYEHALHRTPSPSEQTAWENQVTAAGTSDEDREAAWYDVACAITASGESFNRVRTPHVDKVQPAKCGRDLGVDSWDY